VRLDFFGYNFVTGWDLRMSQKTFDVDCLSENLPDLLSDIQNHVEITLTRQSVPWAEVLPVSKSEEYRALASVPDLNCGSMVMSDDFKDESEEINSMFYDSVIFP